jgi:hypothetical protein
MWWFDRMIEEKIERAKEQGYFDRLKGEGKPFQKRNDDFAGDDWLKHHLMEEAGVLPEWLSLRKDIDAERPTLQRYRTEAEERLRRLPLREWDLDARMRRLNELYVAQARKVNSMIDQHNHCCPSIQHELVRVREDAITQARVRIKRERVMEFLQRSDDECVR